MPPASDLAYWMGNFVRKLNGNEYLVVLLERYDIRSTFDETITWIWLRYSKSTSSKQAEPISPEEKAMLVKSVIGTLTTNKTSRNNNIHTLISALLVYIFNLLVLLYDIQSICLIMIV